VSPGVRSTTRTLPLAPRNGVNACSAASVRYAVDGAWAVVSAAVTARVVGVTPATTLPPASAPVIVARCVTRLQTQATVSVPRTSDETTSSQRSPRGETPGRCHQLSAGSGSWSACSRSRAISSAAWAIWCPRSSGAAPEAEPASDGS
jgi:hypothetical protein